MKGITCECRVYNDILTTHTHSFAQLILPLKGVLNIETKNKKFDLNEKSLFFLPPDSLHGFKSHKPNEFLVLDIPEYMIDNKIYKFNEGMECSIDERLEAVRFLILKELRNANSEGIVKLFNYFSSFMFEGKISSSIKYIEENFSKDINLHTLANIEHYNTTYYSEWFKKNMNMTPIEYIQRLRIKKGKELLSNTDLSIIRIAQEVGYNHHSSFTRIFTLQEKITPLGYRRKIREVDKNKIDLGKENF
ncbi:AraC family transcriptional regulator [Clostridium sp.]|uniref:AraC family transcriptional regulator n=1 Tax=Clostridium sp. TaxID=1506 RepID=UPI003464246A